MKKVQQIRGEIRRRMGVFRRVRRLGVYERVR